MQLTRDLLGDPITLPQATPRERAEYFYDLADQCAPNSEERAAFYRKAAEAQRMADAIRSRKEEAAVELEEKCAERCRTAKPFRAAAKSYTPPACRVEPPVTA